MGFFDGLRSFLTLDLQERSDPFLEPAPTLEAQIAAIQARGVSRPWRAPSIREALGVPSILRAVSLISSTAGMLSIQGYRNGTMLDETPRLIARPDPYQTPMEFYGSTAYCMASRGEFVWWIANRDSDGNAASLIVVPPHELKVEDNPRNRLFPEYTWGEKTGTRFSAANPNGQFVHQKFLLTEPFALRGTGPLQLAQAATSVSVEAQEWAANFYAGGGHSRETIKVAGEVTSEEAALLQRAWMASPNNVPRVIDAGIDSVTDSDVNPQGAQMLEARQHNNGDAARMFGIPGSLLEYQQPGSSLTYQNLEGEFGKFVKVCLQPLYLEPIEQALSDLLTRSSAARFNIKGFLRADAKTRAEIYNILVPLGVMSVEQAQAEEGIVAGNVEFDPVPAAPPGAIITSLPQVRSEPMEVRCDGMMMKRRAGIPALETCGKLLSKTGSFDGRCARCKKDHDIKAPQVREVRTVMPLAVRRPEVITAEQPESVSKQELAANNEVLLRAVEAMIAKTTPPRQDPVLNINQGAFQIHVDAPEPAQFRMEEGAVQVNVEAPEPAQMTIADGAVRVNVGSPDITLKPPALPADTEEATAIAKALDRIDAELRKPRIVDKEVVRDADGRITGVRETETR